METEASTAGFIFKTLLYQRIYIRRRFLVIVTFMKKCFVDELHWIDEQEMLDFTALAQSCPGAIAVNGGNFGWLESIWVCRNGGGSHRNDSSADGDSGGFIRLLRRVCVERPGGSSTRGNASRRGGCDSGCFLWAGVNVLKEKKLYSIAIMIIAFLADFVLDVNVIYIIAAGILAGTIRFIWMRKREQTAGAV